MAIVFLYVGVFLIFLGISVVCVALNKIEEIRDWTDDMAKNSLNNIILKILVLTIIPTLCITSMIMGISFIIAMTKL